MSHCRPIAIPPGATIPVCTVVMPSARPRPRATVRSKVLPSSSPHVAIRDLISSELFLKSCGMVNAALQRHFRLSSSLHAGCVITVTLSPSAPPERQQVMLTNCANHLHLGAFLDRLCKWLDQSCDGGHPAHSHEVLVFLCSLNCNIFWSAMVLFWSKGSTMSTALDAHIETVLRYTHHHLSH